MTVSFNRYCILCSQKPSAFYQSNICALYVSWDHFTVLLPVFVVFMDSDKRIALKMAPMFVSLMFVMPYMYSKIMLQFYYRYIFNACVKSVLLCRCETWLVTSEIRCKIQIFVNRCLRYILRIWWPNIISNKDLWRVTDQEDINLEIRKRKFRWISHTLRKEDGEISK